MRMLEVQLDPSSKRIAVGISRFAEDISDLSPFFEGDLEPEIIKHFVEQFEKEGAGKTGKWKPLTDSYLIAKTAKYGIQPILVARGDLRKLMTDSTLFTSQSFPDQYIVWTYDYGIYHQTGTRKMDARPMLDMTDEVLFRIGKRFHTWAFRAWREATKDIYRQSVLTEYEMGKSLERVMGSA